MKATFLHAPRDIRLDGAPDPVIALPTDAVVQVRATCVCGSDLWPYRGINEVKEPRRIGHEFVGTVVDAGSQVSTVRKGDFVISPFTWSDGTCDRCASGIQTSCSNGGGFGGPDRDGHMVDGCQGEFIRVPQADGTLVRVEDQPDDDLLPSLLTCSDVFGTGWHAAVSADVCPGDTVVVVGDGAVGLCAVLAARRMGAARIIAMSRHASRQAVAREFGATDIVETRGDEGAEEVMELTGGRGADAALECVGTGESMKQALACIRPGGIVGFVGVPHGVEVPIRTMFADNKRIAGGLAPVRRYLPHLRDDVLAGEVNPGKVFDLITSLDDVAEAYKAMDERRAIKAMLVP